MFSKCIFAINETSTTEKITLSLLSASWLACILQWESFVNRESAMEMHQCRPDNDGLWPKKTPCFTRDWSADSRGLWFTLVATGGRTGTEPMFAHAAGSQHRIVTDNYTGRWETLNILWWRSHPPLPFMVIH